MSGARDLSSYDGEPVSLYQFTRRSTPTSTGVLVTTNWRYVAAEDDYVLGALTFAASSIKDDGIRQNGDSSADQLTISMPASETIPRMFVGSPPSDPIGVLIMRTHRGETDVFNGWNGTIGQVTRRDALMADIICNTSSASLDRQGLRLAWTRTCPHNLYGGECRKSPLDLMVTGTVTATNHTQIIMAEFATQADGWWVGGFIEWIDSYGHAERRGIISHTGDTVRVMGGTDGISPPQIAYGFAGCLHSRTDCNDRQLNLPNHGGHDYMPDVNPFTQVLIF